MIQGSGRCCITALFAVLALASCLAHANLFWNPQYILLMQFLILQLLCQLQYGCHSHHRYLDTC